MAHIKTIGKREFIQHTSKYIKLVEEQGQELVITHHNRPDLVLSKIKLKSLHDLRGSVAYSDEVDHTFRRKWITDSDASGSLIPNDVDQSEQSDAYFNFTTKFPFCMIS